MVDGRYFFKFLERKFKIEIDQDFPEIKNKTMNHALEAIVMFLSKKVFNCFTCSHIGTLSLGL